MNTFCVVGFYKAIEPEIPSAMLSRIKKERCEVQIIRADNDFTTAAQSRIQFSSFQQKQKKQDKNHVKINLTKQLYKLGTEDTRLKPTGTILFKKKIEIKPLYLHCKSSYICIFLERKDRTGGYRQII